MTVSPLPSKRPGCFRVVHTADWHLGKPLADLDRTEEHRRFLAFLLETVIAAEADALVVAGDIFDCATPPQAAVRLYFDFLAALYQRTRCVAVVTAGNHDSPSHLEAPRELLGVLRTCVAASFPENPSELLIPLPSPEQPALVVAAVPFLRERDLRTGRLGQSAEEIEGDLREGLQRRYAEVAAAAEPWRARGVPVLAMGHLTALGASVTPESEREIHVGGLGNIGSDAFPEVFAYVALGHLHRAQAVGGREHLRYAGAPLALSFSEAADAKEVRFLDFEGDTLVLNEGVAVPQPRRLVRLKVAQADLEAGLRAFVPPPSDLPPWVEVVVEKASSAGDLYKMVQDLVADRPFAVVKVTVEREGAQPGLSLDAAWAEEDAEELLGDPKAVFRRRLDQEPDLDAPARAALETAFAELWDQHLEA